MKILLTGAAGFIGPKLAERLVREGHDLVVLSRCAARARERLPWPCEIYEWDPGVGLPPAEALRGIDAVVHLAGHPIASGRWSTAVKARIRDSRVIGTRHLVAGLKRLGAQAPKVFVSASAVGYYGERGNELLTERSAAGSGFLADVCRDWEKEAFEAGINGMRVVCLRTGIVLGRDGGALGKMLPPFEAGVGGVLGGGRQWMSWIHIDDIVGLYLHALKTPACSGAMNATAPVPVTNRDFTKTLAKVLGKSARFPLPAFALRALFGEMATVLFSSSRVSSETAIVTGYAFRHPFLEAALRDLEIGDRDEEFRVQQWFGRPVNEIFSFFEKAANLEMITPQWLHFRMLDQSTPELHQGTLVNYELRLHGIPVTWVSRVDEWRPESFFEDTLVKGPYSKWRHAHVFETVKGGTLVTDSVSYRVPGGIFGKFIVGPFVRRDLRKIFKYRQYKLATLFPSPLNESVTREASHGIRVNRKMT